MRYFYLCLLSVTFFSEALFSQALPLAEDILNRADENLSGTGMCVDFRQVVTRTTGEKRVMTLQHVSVEKGKKQVLEFYSPESIRGVRISMLDSGKDIKVYSPLRKESERITDVQKKAVIMGSDFTFEDIIADNLARRFSGRTLRTERFGDTDCYVLSLRPVYEDSGYTRVLMWIGKKDSVLRKIDYYQEHESTPYKRLILKDVKDVNGKKFPMEWYMLNLNNGGKTFNEVVNVSFDKTFRESFFEIQDFKKNYTGGN